MKEFCGFEDSKGGLHRTKKDCEQVEIRLKIKELTDKLDMISTGISDIIFENHPYPLSASEIERKVASMILSNIDYMLEIKRESSECKEELNSLYEAYRESKNNKKPWYMNCKWW